MMILLFYIASCAVNKPSRTYHAERRYCWQTHWPCRRQRERIHVMLSALPAQGVHRPWRC